MNSHNPMNIAADFAKATGGTARKVVALTDKGPLNGFKTVSYTHLDVYKRQVLPQAQAYELAPLPSHALPEPRHAQYPSLP